ncbi:MAG: YHYH protein [Rhizobiaceae bacterium]
MACGFAAPIFTATGFAAGNADISTKGDRICITSNGLPGHATGKFPNSGNPHTIRPLRAKYCVDATPKKGSSARAHRGTVGVGLNGVAIRPGTADYWDPHSPRGFSRDRSSGWNLEGIGARKLLGMDNNNAHVDERGLYHYHGVPKGLLGQTKGSHIGYAADGFEIHYVGASARSGYRLKKGTRPNGPGGKYDGTYVQDWEYVGGAGKLDECNGGMLNGQFVYFATHSYPFFPRCFWGKPSRDFRR